MGLHSTSNSGESEELFFQASRTSKTDNVWALPPQEGMEFILLSRNKDPRLVPLNLDIGRDGHDTQHLHEVMLYEENLGHGDSLAPPLQLPIVNLSSSALPFRKMQSAFA